jgi:hypothetical protein
MHEHQNPKIKKTGSNEIVVDESVRDHKKFNEKNMLLNPIYNYNPKKKKVKQTFISKLLSLMAKTMWVLISPIMWIIIYPLIYIKRKLIDPILTDVFISFMFVFGRFFSGLYYIYSSLRHLADILPASQLQFLQRFSNGLGIYSFSLVLIYSVVRLYNLLFWSKSKSWFSWGVKITIAVAVLGLSISGLVLSTLSLPIAPFLLLAAISLDSFHSLYRFVRMKNKLQKSRRDFKIKFGISFDVLIDNQWGITRIDSTGFVESLINKIKKGNKLSGEEVKLLGGNEFVENLIKKGGKLFENEMNDLRNNSKLVEIFNVDNRMDNDLLSCYKGLLRRHGKVKSRRGDWYETLGTVLLSVGLTALAIVPGYLPIAALVLTVATLVTAVVKYKRSRQDLKFSVAQSKAVKQQSSQSLMKQLSTYKAVPKDFLRKKSGPDKNKLKFKP